MISTKKYFIAVVLLILVQFTLAQKIELNLNAYDGIFSYYGIGATNTSWVHSNPYPPTKKYSANNVYGKKGKFSYTIEFQVKKITKKENIYGLGLSLESLTSKVNIDTAIQENDIYLKFPFEGQTTLKNSYITLNPFVGHKFIFDKLSLCVLTGIDISYCMKSYELGKASTKTFFEGSRDKPSIDFRPRIQIQTQYNKLGMIVGYSLGLTNYQTLNNLKAYTNIIRLGLIYQLK